MKLSSPPPRVERTHPAPDSSRRPHTRPPPRRWLWLLAASILAIAALIYAVLPKKVGHAFASPFAVADPAFENTVGALMRAPFVGGNAVDVLLNGDEIFPAMLRAIREAQHSITLETYIWSSGRLSDDFIAALAERARSGVKAHVMVDGIGTINLSHDEMNQMKDAGVEFVTYEREHWYEVKLDLNHRTHRKLLVVDGRIGFTGGVCIGDEWLGDGRQKDHWRDTHVRVTGPIVAQMQAVFATNWLQTTGRLLVGPDYFPELRTEGSMKAQALMCGPNEDPESIRTCLLIAIASARKSIRLAHAYFVPDDLVLDMLLKACERGVQVEVIVPLANDSRIGRAASRSRWGPLLAAGGKIYRYTPALYHCKTIIIDDEFVSIGSVNFDNRSFTINDEFNLNLLGRGAARRHVEVFADDLAHSTPFTTRDYQARSIFVKLFDKACGLLRAEL
jgi:cardiolipin synthase